MRMLKWSRDKTAKWWDISLHDEQLTSDDRIREFEVRSATQLNAEGDVVPLGLKDWQDKRDDFERNTGTKYQPNLGRSS